MAKTKYIIKLTDEEYERLKTITQSKEESERTILRAIILMMSDAERNEKLSVTWAGNQIALVCYCFLFVPDLECVVF